MVTNEHIKETEKIAYAIVKKFGEFNGVAFEMFPTIPSIFTSGLDFYNVAHDVDFLKVETSDKGLVCWFIDKDEKQFFLSLKEVLSAEPMLYSAIITYLYGLFLDE
jgi:hypothetical protein